MEEGDKKTKIREGKGYYVASEKKTARDNINEQSEIKEREQFKIMSIFVCMGTRKRNIDGEH